MLLSQSATRSRSLSFGWKLSLAFVLCSLLSFGYIFTRPAHLRLTLEMAASQPSTAQLFYNVGTGYREEDSGSVPEISASLRDFRELSFPLPRKKLFQLRFDPMVSAGSVVIRNITIRNGNAVLFEIAPSSVQPFNQISTCVRDGNEIRVVTTPGANDPGLTFALARPLQLHWLLRGLNWRLFIVIDAVLFFAALAILAVERRGRALWLSVSSKLRQIDEAFAALARRLSTPGFIQFDSISIWVYSTAVVLFLLGGVLNLNGSSEGMYSSAYGRGPRVKTWLGAPRAIRSDEWAYQTPDILNQSLRADHFAVESSALGNHNVALTGNMPVRHFTAVFRPQFWPFFVLPVDYAYAFYWQAKALLLCAGLFTFLLWITRSSYWALVGALWYFFSPCTQWSYSWPSALPEMTGCLCLATVLFAYLTVGRKALALLLCAIGAAACTINFALCAYLPHMIPLFWVAFAVFIAWCAVSYNNIFVRDVAIIRMAAVALAAGLIAITGWRTYAELKLAIISVTHTVYPGQRITTAGSAPIWEFAAHFMPWTETQNQFPAALGNICEGSGFLWLAPITLLCMGRVRLGRFEKAALIASWCAFLLLFAWAALPMPGAIGHLLGLDKLTGPRCFPALGLANITIVAISMTGLARAIGKRRWLPINLRDAVVFVLAFLVTFAALHSANMHLAGFFSTIEVIVAALFAAGLIVCMLTIRQSALALALIVPEALLFGSVNPVERGLPVFTRSELHEFVERHPEALKGRWLVYSDTPVSSGFFAASGCRVYTGLRYLPDIDHFALFAAHGLDVNLFNRLGYLNAHPITKNEKTSATWQPNGILTWNVAPTDSILQQIGIRYVAFDLKPTPDLENGLKALSTKPIDGFWLFELPR